MFNSDVLSDVRLVVQASINETDAKKSKMAIPTHKFVLSICSPVFFAMFYGEMAEKSDSIDLPDCQYEGVLEMLRYMYSEEVKLNESNVMQVLYVAKKYILPSLADECIDFLLRNMDPTNVFSILTLGQQFNEKSLVDQCWELIDRETKDAVNSEGFASVERSLLESIVKRDSLSISEVELFKAVDLWATKECERKGLAADGGVKRRILGEQIVKEIRFPAMEEKEFVSVVLDSDILHKEEMRDLMKNFHGVLPAPVGFPDKGRVGTHQSCCRFETLAHFDEKGGWNYSYSDKMRDCLKFWVDEDVMLHGISLFGNERDAYEVSLDIIDCQTNNSLICLAEESFLSVPMRYKEEDIDVFNVMFEPFVLRKSNKYVVKALIIGGDSCFGVNGAKSVQCNGVTFHFKDYKPEKLIDATSVKCGQFVEFFFKQV